VAARAAKPALRATSLVIRFARGTAAAPAGRAEAAIMRHGRCKSVQIARGYVRQGARWDDCPAAEIDL
jgi:hypothetical protein